MIDFPASPTIGQQFSAGASTYIWDGTAWNLTPDITAPITADTPPVNPAIGQLWWNATTGVLYIWFDDGNSAQWVQVLGGSVAPGSVGVLQSQYSCVARCTSAIPIGQNVVTKVTNLGAEDHDPSNFWDPVNQWFKPTKAGLYTISAVVTLEQVDAGARMVVFLYKNGALYALLGRGTSGGGGQNLGFGGSIGVPMNGTTDTLELYAFTSGANTQILGDHASYPRYTTFTAVYDEAGKGEKGVSGAKNLVINGNFVVNQRAFAGGALSAGIFGHDRWRGAPGGCTYTVANSIATITTGKLQQPIPTGNIEKAGTYVLNWEGTAPGEIWTGAWAPIAKGGTVVLTYGQQVYIQFGVGTLGFVQFEYGDTPTPWEMRGPAVETTMCQRYWERQTATLNGASTSASGGAWPVRITYAVPKRANPSISVSPQGGSGSLGNGLTTTLNSQPQSFDFRANFETANAVGTCSYTVTADAEIA